MRSNPSVTYLRIAIFSALGAASLLYISPSIVYGKGAGSTAANFLKLGVGSRSQAMAESNTAAGVDVTAIALNPALLTRINRQEVGFSHLEHVESVKYDWAGYAYPIRRIGTIGFHMAMLRTGEYASYDANGAGIGTVKSSDLSGGLSYAHSFGDYISMGLTGKYISQSISGYDASAYAGDIGFLYLVPARVLGGGLRMGLCGQNFGTKIKADDLPVTYRLGMEYSRGFLSSPLTLAADAVKPLDGEAYASVGIEYHLASVFAIRGGYSTRKDTGDQWRAGGGFNFKLGSTDGSLDYSFSPLGDFSAAHRISIGFKFGNVVNESPEIRRAFEDGVRLYRDARYADAIIRFNDVLEKNEGHKNALQMIKNCNDKLRELRRVREP